MKEAMTITLQQNTRYLVRRPDAPGSAAFTVLDAVVVELTAAGYIRVIWEASPDGMALPAKQEWILQATFEEWVISELPRWASQINRAATTAGIPRSLPASAERQGPPGTMMGQPLPAARVL